MIYVEVFIHALEITSKDVGNKPRFHYFPSTYCNPFVQNTFYGSLDFYLHAGRDDLQNCYFSNLISFLEERKLV